jgi:hypothetical protein
MWKFVKKSYILVVLGAVVLSLLLWMTLSPLSEPRQRRSLADKFLEALKKQELTVNNAKSASAYKKYKIDLLAEVGRGGDIYFPIALLDYEFLSEEAVPEGLRTVTMEDLRKSFPDDEAKRIFETIKEESKRDKTKDLKIDEANKTISYYSDTPSSYKLHYLLTVTNALGMSLKKNGYVRISKDIPFFGDNKIAEFKY